MRLSRYAVATAVVLMTVTGCSALSGTDTPAGAEPAGGVEKTAVRVGVLPIVDTAVIQRAQTAGYFTAEGLNVELVTVQGGAVALPQLVAGDLDFTWTNWPSAILAERQGGVDLQALGANYRAAPGSFVIRALPRSGIAAPQDLRGKRIAVNTFANITELAARSALEVNGVSPTDVEFVEIPFPDMPTAMDTGQVDAAVLIEPYITQAATTLGAQTIIDIADGPTSLIPMAGMVTTAGFADQNPNTVAAFDRALALAQTEMGDRALVEDLLPTYTRIDPSIVPLLTTGTWSAQPNPIDLQRVSDLMLRFGLLTEPFDANNLLKAG